MNEKISADTIARTVCLALALINQVLAIVGKGTIDIVDNDIYQLVSLAWTGSASLIAWWKNNSITTSAIKADAIMKAMKRNTKEM